MSAFKIKYTCNICLFPFVIAYNISLKDVTHYIKLLLISPAVTSYLNESCQVLHVTSLDSCLRIKAILMHSLAFFLHSYLMHNKQEIILIDEKNL